MMRRQAQKNLFLTTQCKLRGSCENPAHPDNCSSRDWRSPIADQRHLPNAPITEALIDLRVETPADVTIETFAELLARRNNLGYTLKGRIMRGEFGFAFSASEGPRPIGGQSSGIGVRL